MAPIRAFDGPSLPHCHAPIWPISSPRHDLPHPPYPAPFQELHRRKISSFLVTNAQFPEQIEQLQPVTQLYVSVDAATRYDAAVERPCVSRTNNLPFCRPCPVPAVYRPVPSLSPLCLLYPLPRALSRIAGTR